MDEKKVIITCDSTVDLSEELIKKYNIKIFPMLVSLGDKHLKDGIEVHPDDLFDYYEKTGNLAKTSAINFQDYIEYFGPLVKDGYQVVHFNISSSMSVTHNNARLAAEEFEGVYVIDSMNLSTGIALLAIKASELAEQGLSAKEIADEINSMRDKVDASFIIDTLEYLHKGGRCSSVAMLGANLLKLKPCIEVKDGAMGVAKKYRGKLSDVMIEYAKNRLADVDTIDKTRVFITSTFPGDSPLPEKIKEEILKLVPFEEVNITRAGCTVSAHCGPGTLGVIFMRKAPLK